MHKPDEHFSMDGQPLSLTMTDFWAWAYSDLSYNINRSALSEYIVASALSIIPYVPYAIRKCHWPCELVTKDGYIINVKTAAYVQSCDPEHPDFINFFIRPRRVPDGSTHVLDTPFKRHCDFYVFSVYKGMSTFDSPLNLDLWDFYIMSTKILDESRPTQKTISLRSLLNFNPVKCNFNNISERLDEVIAKTKNA